MTMKHKINILLIMLLLLWTAAAYSQSIKLVRTDVDSTRNNFVTSTYVFGFDIVADGIENCNHANIEMTYNQTENVKFSNYRIVDFGKEAVGNVIHEVDTTSAGIDTITAAVFSSETIQEASHDNPVIVRLEFVVLQSAPHGETLQFNFNQARAVVNNEGVGEIVDLDAEPVSYEIHSFIEVWPGDTNHDGVVNTDDFTNLGLYSGYGSAAKSMRSFKRRDASTIWVPQRALAWDSTSITYADCDGNGDVTMQDALVVALNFGKDTSSTNKNAKKTNEILSHSEFFQPRKIAGDNTISIPVNVSSSRNYTAASGRVHWGHLRDKYDIVGLIRGDVFNGENSFLVDKVNKAEGFTDFATGNVKASVKNKEEGALVRLIVKPKFMRGMPSEEAFTTDLTGMSSGGYMFPLQQLTSVTDQDKPNEPVITQSNNNIHIDLQNLTGSISNISLYDPLGNILYEEDTDYQTALNIPTTGFSTGIYYLVLQGNDVYRTETVVISR